MKFHFYIIVRVIVIRNLSKMNWKWLFPIDLNVGDLIVCEDKWTINATDF